MSYAQKRFRKSALAMAIMASFSMCAIAQENETVDEAEAEQDEGLVEEVVVTGIRASILRSIDQKRMAKNVVDSINAEDVGKTTDQNIADALGRITGVSVISADGEGSRISVRGASDQQTTITLNGVELTSTDVSQSVDLSSFSADILSKLEVVKTPSADHIEGSLGGSVNLSSVKPLDAGNDKYSGTLQGRYNDLSENTDHKIQFSGVKTFFDDTFGVAVTLYDETNSYRKDSIRINSYEASEEIRSAVDQHGNQLSNVVGLEATGLEYRLNQNTSDRFGGTLGLQFRPTDNADISFSTTYSKQTKETSQDAVAIQIKGDDNFTEGEVPTTNNANIGAAPFTDPHNEWTVYNTDTRTFTKRLQRFGGGSITRSTGGEENVNLSANLEGAFEFSDQFRMNANIGYSSSEQDSLPGLYTNMQNWKQVSQQVLNDAGDQIEPIGYDCSSDPCIMVTGEGLLDLGEHIVDYEDEMGVPISGNADNVGTTGFNPSDAETFQLGTIDENDNKVSDELLSGQVDFDLDIDWNFISSVEFGARGTTREKFVDIQRYVYQGSAANAPVEDGMGNVITIPGGPLDEIRAPLILGDGIGVDNFLESVGVPRINATDDFTTIDVNKALEKAKGEGDLQRSRDDSQTRNFQIDTNAFYAKLNFALLDDKLTGDFGVRYVKTDVETEGYSGGVFHSFPQNANEAEFDWVTLSKLRDTNLPACPQPAWDNGADRQGYELKFNRIDGLGWDTSSGPDPANWVRLPAFDPDGDGIANDCHDPEYAAWAAAVKAGETPPVMTGFAADWRMMHRYADVSTTHTSGWYQTGSASELINWTGEGNGFEQYAWANPENRSINSWKSEDSHSYHNLLPSLNLNYAITDDLLARFAVSKTMTRPEIDEIRPGYRVNELWATYWGGGDVSQIRPGSVNMYNTRLDPLESRNLDLSFEWYFADAGILNFAFFRKDMKNFLDREEARSYIVDVRDVDPDVGLNADELLYSQEQMDPDVCMPLRTTTQTAFSAADPLVISDDPEILCHEFRIIKNVNGESAKVKGVEIGYSQAYDFLPGYILSGLGTQINYTYQESEYAEQPSAIDPDKMIPGMPVANTPKHTYNATVYWEQDSHQIRLSYRGSTDSLVGTDWDTNLRGRTYRNGSLWNEGRDTLDLNIKYQINDTYSVGFQANNLTDAEYRTYYTSRDDRVVPVLNEAGTGYTYQPLEEGNPLEGEATKSRTINQYKVGTNYRLEFRANF